jgi:hypothetical protein
MSAFAIKTQLNLKTSYLGASENDLSRYENKKYDFRFDHTVDKSREKLQDGQQKIGVRKH